MSILSCEEESTRPIPHCFLGTKKDPINIENGGVKLKHVWQHLIMGKVTRMTSLQRKMTSKNLSVFVPAKIRVYDHGNVNGINEKIWLLKILPQMQNIWQKHMMTTIDESLWPNLAPAWMRASTTSRCPAWAAAIRGLPPSWFNFNFNFKFPPSW